MRKVIVVILAVLALVIGMTAPVFAATSQTVTITAQPAYITMTNTPATWILNGIVGDGVTPKNYIIPSDTYYANPVGDGTAPSGTINDGNCTFTVNLTGSSLNVDLVVNCGNFTGGGATMTNVNGATPGTGTFSAYSWYSGLAYTSKVLMKETGSGTLKGNVTATSLKWGAEIATRTDAWAGTGNSTATMTITATVNATQ